jgi:glyoxylase-like metal-dependent hydrolase (beta-lactamase superfamily II)
MDHIGSVKDLKAIAPNVKVLASVLEAPYINGSRNPVKLIARLMQYDTLSDEEKEQVENFKKTVAANRFPIDEELTDKQVLPICGGIEIVHTPGHTPGHICLFLQKDRIMVLGDSANVDHDAGQITDFYPIYIQDMELAKESIEKIKQYPIAAFLSYHTGLMKM